MSIYLILFLAGAIGIAATALLGVGRGHHGHEGIGHGHHGHAGHGGHAGHHHGVGHNQTAGHHGGHGHANGANQHHHGHAEAGPQNAPWALAKILLFLSPIDLFSLSMGAGAAGMLARPLTTNELLPWIALIGALVFTFGVVRPVFAFALKFVSTPSEGLEGMIAQTATALSRFDAQGRGLVKLIMDAEEKQILATLDRAELEQGVQVMKGDRVMIVDVDPAKNSCRVSKI